MKNIIYVGIFFAKEEMEKIKKKNCGTPLENDITNKHVTIAFKPTEFDTSLFGEIVEVVVVGYGNNGKNEGVKVEIKSDNKILKSVNVPHITLSVGNGGKPVDTGKLLFEDVSDKVTLKGKIGYFSPEGVKFHY